MKLRGRVAIVTGASGDIGSATVRAFAAAGAHVVLAAPVGEIHVLDRLASEVERCGVRALVEPTDVAIRRDIDRLVSATLDAFETIDVLANIAGIGSSPALCDDTDEDLRRVVEVNLLGCARMIHAVLPVMKMQRRGAIVNVGSIAGEAGVMGIYSATKFGLRGLSDTVRREVHSSNISVTLIEPGFVRSRMNVAMGDGLPSPDIVARAVVRAVARPQRRVIVPRYYAIPIFIAKLFPGLMDRVFGDARIQQRLNRDARAERAERITL
ncbi:MAG TPA: SDR family NAD(P)-dependent oxidoreductase [Candidatus Cybelea sp.]|nr:SDR family NAD(P)-dependent oxidoreductase [Candidatus Cybelea sp.]